MKKINEQTKSFLLYGIEDVIKPKEIYKLDGAILFLVYWIINNCYIKLKMLQLR